LSGSVVYASITRFALCCRLRRLQKTAWKLTHVSGLLQMSWRSAPEVISTVQTHVSYISQLWCLLFVVCCFCSVCNTLVLCASGLFCRVGTKTCPLCGARTKGKICTSPQCKSNKDAGQLDVSSWLSKINRAVYEKETVARPGTKVCAKCQPQYRSACYAVCPGA